MVNESLLEFIESAVENVKDYLGKDIYLPIEKDYEEIGSSNEEYKIGHFKVEEFAINNIGDVLYKVLADSHSRLQSSYSSSDIGKTIFCDEHNAEAALKGEQYGMSKDTAGLFNAFYKLEAMKNNLKDTSVFCTIFNTENAKFEIAVMRLKSLMISGSDYHYNRYIDDERDFKRDKLLVACRVEDNIGAFDGVFGQRCFIDSEKAWAKVEEMNQNVDKYRHNN